MSAPAPPVVLRWTPTREDLADASFSRAVETQRSFVLIGSPLAGAGKRSQLFCYLPKAALQHPAEADRLRALLAAVLDGGVRPR